MSEPNPCPFSVANTNDVDPFSLYEQIRPAGPLVWDEGMKGWAVLDYENCAYIETNEDLFRNAYVGAPAEVIEIKGGPGNLTVVSGEPHAKLRNFQVKLLSPRAMLTIREDNVRPVVEFLMARIAAKGRADLTAGFGDQIPVRVIMSLFGMDWQEDGVARSIAQHHEAIATYLGRKFEAGEVHARAKQASAALNALLLPYVRERRDGQGKDFISRIWQGAPQFYGDIDEATVLSICRELFFAGGDTTAHAIANALYLYLTRHDLRGVINADRGQPLSSFIEETMRLYGSVQYRFRVANQDCVIGNVNVRKDQVLILLHAAANRDPVHYANPVNVDLNRRPPADHLAFNRGPRTCLGASLARTEINLALQAVMDRLPTMRFDPAAEQPRFRSLFFRSHRPLNVVYD
jgi:cytochrome P450